MNQIRKHRSQPFLSLLLPWQVCLPAKSAMVRAGKPAHNAALWGFRIMLASIQEIRTHFFYFFSEE
jgi:hypothetical protein